MPGKPFQSKLASYEEEIRSLLQAGTSYRRIAAQLNERYQLGITHNAVFSFMKTRMEKRPAHKQFYDGFPHDIRESLMQQVAALWTHESTAIEGNTLTLGETLMVMEHGLTISGKPLQDHQEVYGHARAIDLINEMVQVDSITESDLFDLHKAVMDKSAIDYLRPIGGWKREENGTTGMKDGKMVYMEYASPSDTPHLMERWLVEFNKRLNAANTAKRAIETYAWAHLSFVRVHPFFDGNGRMARLLANLPVLRGGLPPIVIDVADRAHYIDLLWTYATHIGTIRRNSAFVPKHENIAKFKKLLQNNWSETIDLVETARKQQKKRTASILEASAESPLEAGDATTSTPENHE
ncbi:MAG: Fic family protein [Verrucomicrobiota bacterium]